MPDRRHTQRFGRLHVFLPLEGQRLAAHDPRHVEPEHGADGQEHQHEIPPEEHHQHDDEEDEGQRIENVDDAHHHLVRPAAGKSRDGAIDDTDHHRHEACQKADGQRHAAGGQRAGEQVTSGIVGAEEEVLTLDIRSDGEPQAIRGLLRPPPHSRTRPSGRCSASRARRWAWRR